MNRWQFNKRESTSKGAKLYVQDERTVMLDDVFEMLLSLYLQDQFRMGNGEAKAALFLMW